MATGIRKFAAGREDPATVAYLCGPGEASQGIEGNARRLAAGIRLPSFSGTVALACAQAKPRKPGQRLSVVSGVREAEVFYRGLGPSAEDDRWPALLWLRTAAVREGSVTLAVHGRDGRAAGFGSFRRVLAVEIDEGDRLSLCYSIRPDYVYVAPDRRGMGYSSVLREGLMPAIDADFRILAERGTAGLPMGFEVLGTAESDEGSGFMERLRLDMKDTVERRFSAEDLQDFGYDTVMPAF